MTEGCESQRPGAFPILTEPEARYIVTVLNGLGLAGEWTLTANLAVPLDPDAPGWEHIEPFRGAIERAALLDRIASWTPHQRDALIGAVRRFWEPGWVPDVAARLREIGLVESDDGDGVPHEGCE